MAASTSSRVSFQFQTSILALLIIPLQYLPDKYLGKGKDTELEAMVLKLYSKLTGYSEEETRSSYLEYVKTWAWYGSTFFFVEPVNKSNEFPGLVLRVLFFTEPCD